MYMYVITICCSRLRAQGHHLATQYLYRDPNASDDPTIACEPGRQPERAVEEYSDAKLLLTALRDAGELSAKLGSGSRLEAPARCS